MKHSILFTATFAAALTLASSAACATNKLESVKLEPARIKAGSAVTITVSGDETQGNNCGFRINYGNGEGLDVKVTNNDQFPRTFTKTYPQPGTYTVSAESKKVTSHFGCSGGAKATLVVEALPAPTPPPAPATVPAPVPAPVAKPAAKAVGPSCPDSYQASYVAKDGSYQCRPLPNTAAKTPVCPEGYQASYAAKDGSFGCRPLPKPVVKPAPRPVAKMQCPPDLIYFENPDGAFGCRKPVGK